MDNRYRIWLLVFFIVIIGCGLSIYLLRPSRVSGLHSLYYSPYYSTRLYPLDGDASMTQTFQPSYPGLNSIDIYFQTQPNTQGKLSVRLKKACDSPAQIAEFTIDATHIFNGYPVTLAFPPLDESKGRQFCLIVARQPSEAQSPINILASDSDIYPLGKAVYQKNSFTLPPPKLEGGRRIFLPLVQKSKSADELEFDIGFTLHYRGQTNDMLQTLLNRLAAHKPYPLGTSWFYIGILMIYLFGFAVFWWSVVKLNSD